MFQKIAILIILLIVCGCYSEKDKQEEAIHKAEEFVVAQGYAHKKINLDSTSTELGVLERSVLSKKQIRGWRYNSLIPKAVYFKKRQEGWLVGFQYTENEYWDLDTTVIPIRQVIVNDNGLIRIKHEDLIIDKDSLVL